MTDAQKRIDFLMSGSTLPKVNDEPKEPEILYELRPTHFVASSYTPVAEMQDAIGRNDIMSVTRILKQEGCCVIKKTNMLGHTAMTLAMELNRPHLVKLFKSTIKRELEHKVYA